MEMPVEKVIMAVNALDLKVLSLENVELLQRMVPTDQEVRLSLLDTKILLLLTYFIILINNIFSDKGLPRIYHRKEKR